MSNTTNGFYIDQYILDHIMSFMPLCINKPVLTSSNFKKLLRCALYQVILRYGLNTFKLRTNITKQINYNKIDVSMQTEYLIYKWLKTHTIIDIKEYPGDFHKYPDELWSSTGKISMLYRGYIIHDRYIYNYCRAWLIHISHDKINITLDQFNLKRRLCVELETTIQTIINWHSIQSLAKWNFINTPIEFEDETHTEIQTNNSICNGCLQPSCPNRFCIKSVAYKLKYNELNKKICNILERPGTLGDPTVCYQFYNIMGTPLPNISTLTNGEVEIAFERLKMTSSYIPITKTILNWSCNSSKLERNSLGLKRGDKQYKNKAISWLDAINIY